MEKHEAKHIYTMCNSGIIRSFAFLKKCALWSFFKKHVSLCAVAALFQHPPTLKQGISCSSPPPPKKTHYI